MSKHINIFGYGIWIPSQADRETERIQGRGQSLYGPGVLAGYSLLNPSFGTLLYGMNLLRRDEAVKGISFIVVSCLFVIISIFLFAPGNQKTFFINTLVALSLYQSERPKFDAAIRNGFRRARWWPPLIGIVVLLVIYSFRAVAT